MFFKKFYHLNNQRIESGYSFIPFRPLRPKKIIEKTPNFTKNKVFYGHLSDLMQGKKLNPDAFSPFAESKSTPDKTALGKLLFSTLK